jgi:hypothetical protein
LGAFIQHVQAFVQGGVLSGTKGQTLIDAAQHAIDELNS